MQRRIKMTNSKSCCWHPRSRRSRLIAFVAAAFFTTAVSAPARCGSVPDWLNAAAQKPLPGNLDKETNAIVLISERQVTVNDSGEVLTLNRIVIRILRPEGRSWGDVQVYFSPDNPLISLKGWSIPPSGKSYEVGQQDAVEITPYSYELYSDTRLKLLKIPAAAGSVIGYEYVQKERPFFLETNWSFQDSIPVELAQLTLTLPHGWQYTAVWRNYAAQNPQSSPSGQYAWQVENLGALKPEDDMPAWNAVAGNMLLSYYPNTDPKGGFIGHTWSDLGSWYYDLTRPRQQDSAQIRAKVAEITAGASSDWDRVQRLAAYTQSQIRYVAIEIGIGGYQPHPASDVFRYGYGDCKDKSSLLATMLRDANIESYMVLINTERGEVLPEFPTRRFNHAVLAIRLPDSAPPSHFDAEMHHPQLGRLLIFDPTNSYVPIGQLPYYLQANYGLLSRLGGGEILALPLAPPESSRRNRVGKFTLTASRNLSGEVSETSIGAQAATQRPVWQSETTAERTKRVENFLSYSLAQFSLTSYDIQSANDIGKDLGVHYIFESPGFAHAAGTFLVVRPCVLGQFSRDLMERPEPRRYPVEFRDTGIQEDDYAIVLPQGYAADDMPDSVNLSEDFAEYHSQVTFSAGILHYHRTMITKKLSVPINELPALKQFYRKIGADESSGVLLRAGSS
jgi:transglutaminase-like putative cysteine protease